MAQDKVYPKGFYTFAKHPNAPDWVLGTLNLDVTALLGWLKSEGKQYLKEYKGNMQLKLDIQKAKDGRINFSVNTYEKKGNSDYTAKAQPQQQKDEEFEGLDGLPF